MINRELIRLKAVQILYSHYNSADQSSEAAEKEFMSSLDKAYELYQFMLMLMVSIHHMAVRIIEMRQSRAHRLGEDDTIPTKFVQNRFIAQLRENEQLRAFQDKNNTFWSDEEEFLRQFYNKITEQPFYQEYMQNGDTSYEEDRELWRLIYRNLIIENEEIDEILEDHCIYWNDDRPIVDTFVLKTIRRFEEKMGPQQPLLPEFKDTEDRDFAITLFRTALKGEDYFRGLIKEQTKNWDVDRIALMDLVIMQVALAEITSFPEIPLSVSINEYVEVAKYYSTPRSGSYINGMLDKIAKRLIQEGKIDEK